MSNFKVCLGKFSKPWAPRIVRMPLQWDWQYIWDLTARSSVQGPWDSSPSYPHPRLWREKQSLGTTRLPWLKDSISSYGNPRKNVCCHVSFIIWKKRTSVQKFSLQAVWTGKPHSLCLAHIWQRHWLCLAGIPTRRATRKKGKVVSACNNLNFRTSTNHLGGADKARHV